MMPDLVKALRIALLDVGQQAQRFEVPRAGPNFGVKPWHGFEIVVEHVGLGVGDDFHASRFRRKSGVRTSMVVVGEACRIALIVSAK